MSRQSLLWLRGRTIGALRAERHTSTSAKWTSCSACHELLCSRAFLFIVLRSAQHPQIPRFMQIFRGIWPMPLSLLNHSALALFAQRTRISTSAHSIGFCTIWVCISSSSSSLYDPDLRATHARTLLPAALASVSSGVLVRVRVRIAVSFYNTFHKSLLALLITPFATYSRAPAYRGFALATLLFPWITVWHLARLINCSA